MVVSSNLDALNCKKGISIIIPAYNERDRIKQTLDKYLPVIESFNLAYEIIVVIDGLTILSAEKGKLLRNTKNTWKLM